MLSCYYYGIDHKYGINCNMLQIYRYTRLEDCIMIVYIIILYNIIYIIIIKKKEKDIRSWPVIIIPVREKYR